MKTWWTCKHAAHPPIQHSFPRAPRPSLWFYDSLWMVSWVLRGKHHTACSAAPEPPKQSWGTHCSDEGCLQMHPSLARWNAAFIWMVVITYQVLGTGKKQPNMVPKTCSEPGRYAAVFCCALGIRKQCRGRTVLCSPCAHGTGTAGSGWQLLTQPLSCRIGPLIA